MDVAVLTMLSSMFAAMLAMFWHLIRENTKTRDLMVRLNHDTRAELRADHKELRKDLNTLGTELRADHKSLADELRVGLSGVRDRLSRLEGHLGIGIDPPTLQPDE